MYRNLRIRCPEGSFDYHVLHLFTPVSMMDKLCKVGADRFHFIFGIRIAVWNPVDDLIQIIMFLNDIKTYTERDITEISKIGYPVIHFGYTVRGINALIFEYSVINDRSDLLCTNFFA